MSEFKGTTEHRVTEFCLTLWKLRLEGGEEVEVWAGGSQRSENFTYLIFFSDQAKRGMISIVDEWMKGHHREKQLYPCWKSLVYIVADKIGGRNPAAARGIALKWKGV